MAQRINPDENKAIADCLAAKSKDRKCQWCGSQEWGLEGHVCFIPVWAGETATTKQQVAVVLLNCYGCGNVLMFTAKDAGYDTAKLEGRVDAPQV